MVIPFTERNGESLVASCNNHPGSGLPQQTKQVKLWVWK